MNWWMHGSSYKGCYLQGSFYQDWVLQNLAPTDCFLKFCIDFVDMKMWIIMNRKHHMQKRLIPGRIIFIHCMLLLVPPVRMQRPNSSTVVLNLALSLMLLTSLHQQLAVELLNAELLLFICASSVYIYSMFMKICCLQV